MVTLTWSGPCGDLGQPQLGQSSLLSHGDVSIALEAKSSKDNHSSQQARDQRKQGTGLSKQRRAWPCRNYSYLRPPLDPYRPSPMSNPNKNPHQKP